MIRLFLLVVLLIGFAVPGSFKIEKSNVFSVADIIASDGYPSENHHVTTSDGYILEMHRIPHGRNMLPSEGRPAVFVMHGLMADSHSFILLGPEHAIPYNLADAGFDVWMGNSRGNKHSRSHLTLDPDDSQEKFDFFDFSFEEIGLYDIPAMIDYILAYTGQEKLHYVGHSQGGTVFLVLMSMKPEYNEKVSSAHLLAGVGYQDNFPSTLLAILARLSRVLYNIALAIGFVETSVDNFIRSFPSYSGEEDMPHLSEKIGLEEIMSDRNVFDGYTGGGGSSKQIVHFGQNVRDSAFRRWSYGIIRNRMVYGTSSPPAFDLSHITANVTMHYTVADVLLNEIDVLAMANVMQNTAVRRIARDNFRHMDFIAAHDVKELVTDYIIQGLREVEGISGEPDTSEEEDSEPTPSPGSAHNLLLSNLLKMYLIILVALTLLRS